MRHRSIENRLKTLTRYGFLFFTLCRTNEIFIFSALIDCLVLPLQEKLEDWRRSVATMDKEHARGKQFFYKY